MPEMRETLRSLNDALFSCSAQSGRPVRLLAVSKTQPVEAIAACYVLGQRAFGENYVQEALEKISALQSLDIEWHLIGALQSNKCQPVAEHFDWVQTVDREKIIDGLSRYRPNTRPPLNVLIQVNVDDEAGKAGCLPAQAASLADRIAAKPNLRLRGLMAIPDPQCSADGKAFAAMQRLFHALQAKHPGMDTLSMGMSDDYPIAIAHGANLVRVGTALFGARPKLTEHQ
jgi:pyridoxal phosphate enzyme (YggS family)